MLNSIRLIHLLLGDKLDIFLGTLNYLKDDKSFINKGITIYNIKNFYICDYLFFFYSGGCSLKIEVNNDLMLL